LDKQKLGAQQSTLVRLAVYSNRDRRVVVDWHTPEHTAFESNLYEIAALPKKDRQWVERELMSKAVDDPASKILKRLLAGELKHLNSDDRTVWTRFMLAQWWRSPEVISQLRREGRSALLRALEANPEEYQAARGEATESTLPEWVDAHQPGLDEIVAMGRVLPQLINDTNAGTIIVNMRWQVVHLHGSSVDLLTSDRPVIRLQGLNSPNCVIAMPLAPRTLFIASHAELRFHRHPPKKIARLANVTMVQGAHHRVYGAGGHHLPLVEKRLRRSQSDLKDLPE
jgi:hypothetical protein